jgi:hypothetical protein
LLDLCNLVKSLVRGLVKSCTRGKIISQPEWCNFRLVYTSRKGAPCAPGWNLPRPIFAEQ